jgi:sugar/nucleoside kinase (ribokinase family)
VKSRPESGSIVVVGSLGLDDVQTPHGAVHGVLGGSASYFSIAAQQFAPVSLVAVVGNDFPESYLGLFRERGIGIDGLDVVPGSTFKWRGRYGDDPDQAFTLATELGVFQDFHPRLPESYRESKFVFLANIDPELQLEVLQQTQGLKILDTMNYWIEGKRSELLRTLLEVDVVILNSQEARSLTGVPNIFKACEIIASYGPGVVVIKLGEHGSILRTPEDLFSLPAFPVERVVDPTGAGDTFAGGFVGWLARCGETSPLVYRQAMVIGTVMASFTIEDFSLRALLRVDDPARVGRVRRLRELTSFPHEDGML